MVLRRITRISWIASVLVFFGCRMWECARFFQHTSTNCHTLTDEFTHSFKPPIADNYSSACWRAIFDCSSSHAYARPGDCHS